nr:MAG TPA: hypothetical protein [Caudoviricetes sp.]
MNQKQFTSIRNLLIFLKSESRNWLMNIKFFLFNPVNNISNHNGVSDDFCYIY